MALTSKQKQNIMDLDTETTIEIMHICAERLGAVSVSEYGTINGIDRRDVYRQIESKKIKSFKISTFTLCIINN